MIISVNTLLSSIGKSEKAEKIINFCHGLRIVYACVFELYINLLSVNGCCVCCWVLGCVYT